MSFRLLVCDDEPSLREMLSILLRRAGYEVTLAENTAAGLRLIAAEPPFDLVITDLLMPDGSGMQVLEGARKRDAATQIIMITAHGTTEQAVQAMRQGAYDYIQKPFKKHELLATIEKALEKRAIVDENRVLRARVQEEYRSGEIVGKSRSVMQVMDMVRRVASARTSVLITGESGTGKEMVARALHFTGDRKASPFVVVNCGALPESLMESELFGHEKGAFTGATSKKEGLMRAADKGTLFLDEVGELSPTLQVKLLRVLQERKVRPVGGEQETEVDVRIVAATNREVERDVQDGRLRQDLFYRLNVIRIQLPALRTRTEDIPLLAEHLLVKHAAFQGKRLSFAPEALRWLMEQPFPGNVRELENVIERAVTLCAGPTVTLVDLPDGAPHGVLPQQVAIPVDGFDLDKYLGDLERDILVRALQQASGVRTNAAKLLGMSFRSFRYRLAKYGLADADDEDLQSGEVETVGREVR